MKIDIGPYAHHCDGYAFYHWYLRKKYKKPHWILETKDLDKVDLFIEKLSDVWFDILNATINKFLMKRKRKIKIHIDNYDIWGADHTLAMIIHPMLLKIRESKHGAPKVDDDDVPEELRSTSAPPVENEWDTDDNWFKRWDYVLDEMIHTFECAADEEWEGQFHSGKIDWQFVETDRKYDGDKTYTMEPGPNHTHVFDKEAYDKAMKRRENGLRLFGKYYHSLWS